MVKITINLDYVCQRHVDSYYLFKSLSFLMTSWTRDCRLELNVSHRVSLNFLELSL